MKIKRRSIISVVLILAMVFTVSAFTSCSSAEKEETIMVNIKITGSDGIEQSQQLKMVGIPSDLTVLAATKRECEEVLEIDFVYDETLNAVVQIGTDKLNKDSVAEAVGEDVTVATSEGDTTEALTTSDGTYYDWQGYLNGVEITSPKDLIKEGDLIEWKWQKFTPADIKK